MFAVRALALFRIDGDAERGVYIVLMTVDRDQRVGTRGGVAT